MGYKRAGFRVLGNCEIDPRMNAVYVANLHPKYNFLMDLRNFNKLNDLPDELTRLDILDGSPPCSTFSTAGNREADWGREKAFREGQTKQRLDDLFFVFLETVAKLRPKIAVAENVTGLIGGNARGYVNEIIKGFRRLGYEVQIFQMNAAHMDVPQVRERVFFIANNQGFPKLTLCFGGTPIPFGQVQTPHGIPIDPKRAPDAYFLLRHMKKGDQDLRDINMRIRGKNTRYNEKLLYDDKVACTIIANGGFIRACDKSRASEDDFRNISSFPQDYDFGKENAQYICGMSVPPNMMAHIALEIYRQWMNR